ncbi:proline-serine-threonine phosphatase-interacting protein 1-like [Neosynchiropus ocellatus]
MAPLMFRDAFWGPDLTGHAGYHALTQRLRDGRQMCKDVEELLKMRAAAEEKYGKELVAIARKAGGHTEICTLRASFEELKTQLESIGNQHVELSEALREEVKRIEAFRERQKEQRKKFESIMEKIQKNKVSLFKKTTESKKNYEQRCREADEAEQGAERNATSVKHAEKAQLRAKHCRQAATQAEKQYLGSILQLEGARRDWEETHRSTCEVFQQMEGDRISQLRCALWDHCNHFSGQCVRDDELYENVRKVLEECDVTKDNNHFIETKQTGTHPPDPVIFESYYQTDGNRGTGELPGAGGDAPSRCSHPFLSSPAAAANRNSLHTSQPIVTPDSDDEPYEDGYELVRDLQSPTTPVLADEDSYIVLFDFNAQTEEDLTVSRGDVIRALDRGEDGWWLMEKNGLTGLVPGNYVGRP